MRYTQLRSFHAVARAGSFTAAAAACHVSQPTITTQVKQLEDAYGVELFYRRGRRIELTDAGEGLLAVTQRLFSQEEEARQFLTDTKGLRTGHLRVGAVGPFHVTEMLAAFNARYPGIEVSVTVGNSRDVVHGLLDYRSDVAVLAHIDPDPRLHAVPYSRHPVVVFVNREHRWFRRKSVRLADLEGERMILREEGSTTRRAFAAALRERGVRPEIVMEIGSREAIREAVAKGIGIAVVSEAEYVPDPALRPLPVADAEIFTYAHVVCLDERRNARLDKAFLGVVAELLSTRQRRGRASLGIGRRASI